MAVVFLLVLFAPGLPAFAGTDARKTSRAPEARIESGLPAAERRIDPIEDVDRPEPLGGEELSNVDRLSSGPNSLQLAPEAELRSSLAEEAGRPLTATRPVSAVHSAEPSPIGGNTAAQQPSAPERGSMSARRAAPGVDWDGAGTKSRSAEVLFETDGRPKRSYVRWLERRSMLYQGGVLAKSLSGSSKQWQHPFGLPGTKPPAESVWYTAYPNSTLTAPKKSVLATLGESSLWEIFQSLGIQAMHLGPVRRAGGVDGKHFTPTTDGGFDRIALDVDPLLGTDRDYQSLVETAREHGGVIIGDIVPGHTGKGPDWRLATMKYGDYPGLYTMVEVDPKHWSMLPKVPKGAESSNLTAEQVAAMKDLGYIPGDLERVLFSVPGKPSTGWDVTSPVVGVDGKTRRWVYLHYFKPSQPSLNWLDPSMAAQRLLFGDILKSLMVFGARALRLDANPFLGIESSPGSARAWSEAHPLAIGASNMIAQFIRKLGGFSFQELNMGLDDIQSFSSHGPELSYDFITRPAYQHALLTGNADFLKLMLYEMDKNAIDPARMVHAMQNHDEITYELVHFLAHEERLFSFRGQAITGKALREMILREMGERAIGPQAPFNRLSGNGLSATYVGLAAAALGIKDLHSLSAEQKEKIKKAHLLMAMFNAMQPGVFAISGWDLVGALPLDDEAVSHVAELDGDTRWNIRGGYDPVGDKDAATSSIGLPRAEALYGPVSDQLKDPDSFAARLRTLLAAREKFKLAQAKRIPSPKTQSLGVVAMLHQLPGESGKQLTILNFAQTPAAETLSLEEEAGVRVVDMISGELLGRVSETGKLTVKLDGLEGKALLLKSS